MPAVTTPRPDTAAPYRQHAESYARHAERSAYNDGYERPALRALVGDVAGLRLLDLGCAGGANLGHWRDREADAVGLDVAVPLLRLCRARHPAVPVVAADLGDGLPFADGTIDVVVASLVLHYLDDWAGLLAQVHRVLRPGGRLVLSVHHPVWDWPLLDAGDYHRRGWVTDSWTLDDGTVFPVQFHRKTLGDVVTSVAAALRVRRLVEPLPVPEVAGDHPDDWATLSRRPVFLLLEASRD